MPLCQDNTWLILLFTLLNPLLDDYTNQRIFTLLSICEFTKCTQRKFLSEFYGNIVRVRMISNYFLNSSTLFCSVNNSFDRVYFDKWRYLNILAYTLNVEKKTKNIHTQGID